MVLKKALQLECQGGEAFEAALPVSTGASLGETEWNRWLVAGLVPPLRRACGVRGSSTSFGASLRPEYPDQTDRVIPGFCGSEAFRHEIRSHAKCFAVGSLYPLRVRSKLLVQP